MILLSHVAMRLKMSKEEVKNIKFPMPFWPIGPAITIAFMVFVIALLGFFENTQVALIVGVVWVALLSIAFYAMRYYQKR
ncbi:Proline-specific permease ProY [Providencia rustigianii]|nr:Proline-specific permease ProY [Providencia rustigianii]